jgi:hypothetical protein
MKPILVVLAITVLVLAISLHWVSSECTRRGGTYNWWYLICLDAEGRFIEPPIHP